MIPNRAGDIRNGWIVERNLGFFLRTTENHYRVSKFMFENAAGKVVEEKSEYKKANWEVVEDRDDQVLLQQG